MTKGGNSKDSGERKDEENLVFTIKDKAGLLLTREFLDICARLGRQGSKVFFFKKGMKKIVDEYKDADDATWRQTRVEFQQYLKDMHPKSPVPEVLANKPAFRVVTNDEDSADKAKSEHA